MDLKSLLSRFAGGSRRWEDFRSYVEAPGIVSVWRYSEERIVPGQEQNIGEFVFGSINQTRIDAFIGNFSIIKLSEIQTC